MNYYENAMKRLMQQTNMFKLFSLDQSVLFILCFLKNFIKDKSYLVGGIAIHFIIKQL